MLHIHTCKQAKVAKNAAVKITSDDKEVEGVVDLDADVTNDSPKAEL
jgi:hypothetical protein